MSAVLSRYLKDFGAEALPPSPATTEPRFDDMPAFEAKLEVLPVADIEAERQDAYEQGREETRLALALEYQARLNEIAADHERELEELRTTFQEAAASRITAGLQQICATLAEAISAETAAVLAPVMTEAVSGKAIADLATLVRTAILDGGAGLITVSGPCELFKKPSASLGEDAAILRHVEIPDVDLTVTLGEGVLVTRLSAWADGLRKVLA
jgi:hypothetical protein